MRNLFVQRGSSRSESSERKGNRVEAKETRAGNKSSGETQTSLSSKAARET